MSDAQADEQQFTRTVTMAPAFDKRDADPKKNYGIHGVEMRMVLKGPLGAVQFVLYTGWHLPHVQEWLAGAGHEVWREPTPADLGYHWPTARYEGQSAMKCDLMPGGECYYDGSSLNADRIFKVLLDKGSDGVWQELEEFYHDLAKREAA